MNYKSITFRIIAFAVLLCSTLQIHAQAKSESWYRNYFREHIDELDPIEGIYSVSCAGIKTLLGTETSRETEKTHFFIAKYKDNVFGVFEGDDRSVYAAIKRIGETNVYEFIRHYPDGDNGSEASTDFHLKSLFYFQIVQPVPLKAVRYTLDYNAARRYGLTSTFDNIRITMQYEFVKEYPTQSMYEAAITAAQKKHEEESKPSEWSGTGWVLGNGYLVTNHHVTDGARTINVKGIGGDMNTGYSAEVVASDKVNDISILKITDRRFVGFGARQYGVTTRMADVGEDVFVLGYPLTQALGNEIKLTNGIISSRTGYQGDVACYQISAPVQPGNSGGPMFDSKGNIIGIVVAGVPGAENVGYAIKTSYLKILIESAGLNIAFPSNNTISTLSLAEKVKRVKNFVYYIECSK